MCVNARDAAPVGGSERAERGGEYDPDEAVLRQDEEELEALAPLLAEGTAQERVELGRPGELLGLGGENRLVGVLREVDLWGQVDLD